MPDKTFGARKAAIGTLVLLLSCCIWETPRLPGAPSELTSGIVVYEHADYLGASAHVTGDVRFLDEVFDGPCRVSDLEGGYDQIWDDCISSIRVAPGWRATLYAHGNYKGDQLQVTEDMPNLELMPRPGDCPKKGFNDCVTSIRVFPP